MANGVNYQHEREIMFKKILVGAAAVAAMAGLGLAGAAIAGNGSQGVVNGKVGTLQNVPVTGYVNGDVFPGHTYGVVLHADNRANPVDVQIDSLTPYEVDVTSGPAAGQTVAVGADGNAAGYGHLDTITPANVVIGAGSQGDFNASPAIEVADADFTQLQGSTFTILYHVADHTK